MQKVSEPEDQSHGEGTTGDRGMLAELPMRGLVYHAVLYLGVVLILLAVNLMVAPDTLWVVWIALIWGILLVWNVWQVFRPGSRDQR